MSRVAERKPAGAKMRVHMDLDRRLWQRFRARLVERGETLQARIRYLVERDLEDLKADTAS